MDSSFNLNCMWCFQYITVNKSKHVNATIRQYSIYVFVCAYEYVQCAQCISLMHEFNNDMIVIMLYLYCMLIDLLFAYPFIVSRIVLYLVERLQFVYMEREAIMNTHKKVPSYWEKKTHQHSVHYTTVTILYSGKDSGGGNIIWMRIDNIAHIFFSFKISTHTHSTDHSAFNAFARLNTHTHSQIASTENQEIVTSFILLMRERILYTTYIYLIDDNLTNLEFSHQREAQRHSCVLANPINVLFSYLHTHFIRTF